MNGPWLCLDYSSERWLLVPPAFEGVGRKGPEDPGGLLLLSVLGGGMNKWHGPIVPKLLRTPW